MKNIDSSSHVRGLSVYVDDILPLKNTLHAAVFGSPIAKGTILSLEIEEAEALSGVYQVITAKDIPGENQIGGIIPDEPLLADNHLHFVGQPVAIILATSELIARRARELIVLKYTEEYPLTSPREAFKSGELIQPPRTFALGNVDEAWSSCDIILEDSVSIAGQEHLYLETQGAYAFITEDNHIRVISSTQGPTAVQRTSAKVLGISMHQIEVDVRRLGGGFGGKEDQATPWAVMAALGTYITKLPVKLILNRHDDLYMTGKRHPYDADFKIGLTKSGKIMAYEVTFYQNAGAAADLSPAVLERTLFHATNSYFIPHVKATGISCRTNLPPNTAFRGFGGPQGMFVIEAALYKAAKHLDMPVWKIQETNLLNDNDIFPYGQVVENCQIRTAWKDVMQRYSFHQLQKEIDDFNSNNPFIKKGIALMPVTFGISFTNTSMNQAGSLVHIYQDGSIGVSTGAVEMGQGVNTRILQVVQQIFGVDHDLIFIESTNTTRIANTSPSAASSTHDLNGKATEIACTRLRERLLEIATQQLKVDIANITLNSGYVCVGGNKTDLDWYTLIQKAYLARVDLSEHGYYATPKIHFDKSIEKGNPFAYHSYGVAMIEVTIDCIRGRYEIDAVKVSHDFGKSMNPIIDLGQMEGGIVQGLGWMTLEELSYDDSGRLLSNSLSAYKIPDLHASPKQIITHFLDNKGNEYGLFKSKAIGEPPLMYGIGGYFAICQAINAYPSSKEIAFHTPMTPERVLLQLYPEFDEHPKFDVIIDDGISDVH